MIDELRIGSYISCVPLDAKYVEVTAIKKDSVEVNNLKNITIPKEYIEPIPITEEWLLKLGFEKRSSYYIRGGITIKESKGKGKSYFTLLNAHRIYLEYVHEVQNLCLFVID